MAPYELLEKQITPEGLLIQTPDQIHTETRVYFWSPVSFEGDVAVEFEFRPEQNTGLALLVVQATGLQREDFLTDHPPRTTGSLSTIIGDRIKNYHWEFFRKAVDVRATWARRCSSKTPGSGHSGWPTCRPLKWAYGTNCSSCRKAATCARRSMVAGRSTCKTTPSTRAGQFINSGCIGLRLMYASRMRFKNLKIWNRDMPVEERPAR